MMDVASRRHASSGPLAIATRVVGALAARRHDPTLEGRPATVTAETVTPPAEHAGSDIGRLLRSADRYRVALGGIVVAQAVWLGVLTSRGWYYQADFSNLAQATGRPLSWSYLTLSQGGHLAIPSRLVFWLLNRTIPLNYPVTIALRLLAQAAATLMLGRLLTLLVGRRRGVLVVLALYAVSPLLVQSTLWLTSSIGFLGSQLFVLAALHGHVRYALTHQLRWCSFTALALLGATLMSEQSAVIAVVLPLLSMAFLHDGTMRRRRQAVLASWPEWLMIAVPIVSFVLYFFASGKYATGRFTLTLPDALRVVGDEWTASIAPALSGGPFRWYSINDNYLAVSDPAISVRGLAGVIMIGVVVVSVRRTGARALLAWAMPAVVSALGIVVVAVGRYDTLGLLIARQFEHSAYTAVPATVAVCLAIWPTTAAEIGGRLVGCSPATSPEVVRPRARRRSASHGRLLGVMAVGVALASIVSATTYAHRWSQSPSRRYVDNLTASARTTAAPVNLFDTAINPAIVPILEPARYISDLVALTGVHARFDQGSPVPQIVAADGRVVPATFLSVAQVDISGSNKFCNDLLSAIVDRTDPLTSRPHRNEWFLRLAYFQQHPSVVYVSLVDDSGRDIMPVGGSRVVLANKLGAAYLRFPLASPTALRIQSNSASTNVCITSAALGSPFPAAP